METVKWSMRERRAVESALELAYLVQKDLWAFERGAAAGPDAQAKVNAQRLGAAAWGLRERIEILRRRLVSQESTAAYYADPERCYAGRVLPDMVERFEKLATETRKERGWYIRLIKKLKNRGLPPGVD